MSLINLRLGEFEKAIHHFKLSRSEESSNGISKARSLQSHLAKCIEVRKQREWQSLLKESCSVAAAGSDSAPQVFNFIHNTLLVSQSLIFFFSFLDYNVYVF